MKRLSYLVLAGTLALAACGDDDGGGGGGVDASAGPDSDLLPTEGTCGINIFPRGIKGFPGGIGEQLAGVPVVFSAPDGTTLGFETTDVKGAASIENCVRGTSITFVLQRRGFEDCVRCRPNGRGGEEALPAIPGPGDSFDIFTYAGANPGDTFYYGGPGGEEPDSLYADANVTLSNDLSGFPLQDGYYNIELDANCDGQSWGFDANAIPEFLYNRDSVEAYCLGDDPSDFDAIGWLDGYAYGNNFDPFDQTDQDHAYAFVKDVPITTGTSEMDFENVVPLGPWMGLHRNNVHLFYPPQQVERVVYRTRGLVDGVPFFTNEDTESYNPDEGEIVPPLLAEDYRGLPADFGEQSRSFAGARLNDNYPRSVVLENRFSPFSTEPTSSLTDTLSTFEGLTITDLATGRPVIRWFTAGGSRGKLGIFKVYFDSFEVDAQATWTLLTPDTEAGEWRSPQLPDQLAALLAEPSLGAEPDVAGLVDFDWGVYGDILGSEGFYPERLYECYGDFEELDGEATEGRMRRSLQYYEDDYSCSLSCTEC